MTDVAEGGARALRLRTLIAQAKNCITSPAEDKLIEIAELFLEALCVRETPTEPCGHGWHFGGPCPSANSGESVIAGTDLEGAAGKPPTVAEQGSDNAGPANISPLSATSDQIDSPEFGVRETPEAPQATPTPRGHQIGDGGQALETVRGIWQFRRALTGAERDALHQYIIKQGGGTLCVDNEQWGASAGRAEASPPDDLRGVVEGKINEVLLASGGQNFRRVYNEAVEAILRAALGGRAATAKSGETI